MVKEKVKLAFNSALVSYLRDFKILTVWVSVIFLNDGTDEVDDQVSAVCPEALNSSL